MTNKFDELAKGLTQSVTRRQALKRFSIGLAGMALACFGLAKYAGCLRPALLFLALAGLLRLPAAAQSVQLGPLVELSEPNAVGACDDGFRLPGTMTVADTAEPFVAVSPVQPNNIVAAWIQGPLQDNIAAASFDGGSTWQQVPLPLSSCAGGLYPLAADPWLA